MPEKAKLTVIIETKTSRRTLVYPEVYDLQFKESFPEPHLGGYRDGGLVVRPVQTHMNGEISLVAVRGEDGHFRTALLEELDPIPDEIRELVTRATRHNINEAAREKLIKALTNLVEKDRKENNK